MVRNLKVISQNLTSCHKMPKSKSSSVEQRVLRAVAGLPLSNLQATGVLFLIQTVANHSDDLTADARAKVRKRGKRIGNTPEV